MPYWGRSRRKLATLLPSTRAFGHVPLAGEVLSDRRERVIVPQEGANEHTADQHPYCAIDKTLIGEQCQRPGEVRLNGYLLCVRHAELLKLEDRSETLLGTVSEMDKWLDDTHNHMNELRWRRVLRQRDEVVEELRSIRTQIEVVRRGGGAEKYRKRR